MDAAGVVTDVTDKDVSHGKVGTVGVIDEGGGTAHGKGNGNGSDSAGEEGITDNVVGEEGTVEISCNDDASGSMMSDGGGLFWHPRT